jgi:hypothetical protein
VYLTVQDLAEQAGDTEKVGELTRKLEELEERAEELDKQRSKGLSAIRSARLHTIPCYHSKRSLPSFWGGGGTLLDVSTKIASFGHLSI